MTAPIGQDDAADQPAADRLAARPVRDPDAGPRVRLPAPACLGVDLGDVTELLVDPEQLDPVSASVHIPFEPLRLVLAQRQEVAALLVGEASPLAGLSGAAQSQRLDSRHGGAAEAPT